MHHWVAPSMPCQGKLMLSWCWTCMLTWFVHNYIRNFLAFIYLQPWLGVVCWRIWTCLLAVASPLPVANFKSLSRWFYTRSRYQLKQSVRSFNCRYLLVCGLCTYLTGALDWACTALCVWLFLCFVLNMHILLHMHIFFWTWTCTALCVLLVLLTCDFYTWEGEVDWSSTTHCLVPLSALHHKMNELTSVPLECDTRMNSVPWPHQNELSAVYYTRMNSVPWPHRMNSVPWPHQNELTSVASWNVMSTREGETGSNPACMLSLPLNWLRPVTENSTMLIYRGTQGRAGVCVFMCVCVCVCVCVCGVCARVCNNKQVAYHRWMGRTSPLLHTDHCLKQIMSMHEP